MTDFIGSVNVNTHVNIFYCGMVQSRTIRYPDGKIQTLGVYLPGEFEFHSDGPEAVVITAGAVEVLFPGEGGWRRVEKGGRYDVPRNTVFKVRCSEISEYICDFL
ncbi:pyrimidine/purine nucleoside phosphorylase [Synergistes jonesii]|uniref:pyrimidine/purine nucleoside phosphorylase n=1 Tax=Synergistes jonesii TaxID=2754 RepID=UPI00248D768A|nr:pyrimidine/purine nucleoside phosphorylase [Synergistes jonesii]